MIFLKKTLFGILLLCSVSVWAQPPHDYTSKSKKAVAAYEEGMKLYNGRLDAEAIEKFKKAAEIDSKFIEAYLVLTEIFTEQKKYAEALEAATTAYSINPSFFPRLLFNIANLEYKVEKYSEAKAHLEEFLWNKNLTDNDRKKVSKLLESVKFAEKAKMNPVPFNPKNLGEGVNTRFDEYGPAVTVDDQTLIYTVKGPFYGAPEDNPKAHSEDFFVSNKKDNHWSKGLNIGTPVNTEWNEGSECISPDGMLMLLTVCESQGRGYPPGRKGYGRCDIFYSQKVAGNWSAPLNMGPAINSKSWDSQPSISADGKTIYFVSLREGGKGGFDIWKSELQPDNTWGMAVNLGDTINTDGTEFSPFIHADGESFYFSSDGHPGMGMNDLFLSKKKPDGSFSKPVNLGYPINSSGDEISLIVSGDGNKAYYSSQMKGGMGGLDLYTFELPAKVKPVPVTYFKGRITDKTTKKPLEARFELIDLQSGTTTAGSYSDKTDGTFLIPLPAGKKYALNVSTKGYLFFSENFDMPKNLVKPFEKDIALEPVVEGGMTVLRNIFFETASYALKQESEVELNKLVEFLKANPSVKGEIAGHTDNVGDRKMNQVLSENRAKTVKDYLINKGIASDRLTSKGYADTVPMVPNDSDGNRAQNRRTEFRITKK